MDSSAPRPLREAGNDGQTSRWLAEGVIRDVRDYAIFLLDPDGYVASWNAGAERIKGYTADEIIGSHFSRFYPQESLDSRLPERELEAVREDGRFENEGWRLRKDGSRFWASVIITAVRDEQGALRGFLKITRDLSERRRQDEILRQSEERFRLLVDGARDYAIVLVDADGRIISWNSGAERITGFSRTEAVGMSFARLTPDRIQGNRELNLARDTGRLETESWRLRKDGTRFWAGSIVTALRHPDGKLRGYATVTRDLSERKRVEALETESREIYEFLAMLAHELRNPLAPVQNALEVMRVEGADESSLRWSREVIERQVGHLARLVDDLLDVSRITAGKITLRDEPVELRTLLTNAVDASRSQFESRSQRLELVTEEAVWVRGDATRLSQVVINLLNNAAKYTPDNGEVIVSLRRDGGSAVIRVRDNGIGMSPELVKRVFDLFAQGDRALARSEGGLGIGLTLVRHLIRLHGGEATAHSEGPGEGSEFTVSLPRIEMRSEPTPAAETTGHQVGAGRVLVVDDNSDSADSMAKLVEMWGYISRTAYDGEVAVDVAREWQPNFVLLDLGLPKMDGYQVARELRSSPGLEKVCIFAMSGYGQDSDKQKTRDAGFDRHLVKPVDLGTLKDLMAKERIER